MRYFLALFFVIITASTSIAGEYTYEPEHCEFQTTFPEKPHIENRCDGGENKDRCYDQIEYTKVFGLDATINVKITCSEIEEKIKNNYSQEVMLETLKVMTSDQVHKEFHTTFTEEDHYKIAGLIGEGKMGLNATLYIAQLWIGKKSAFSLEAQLSGEQNKDADLLLKDLLQSISFKKLNEEESNISKEKP